MIEQTAQITIPKQKLTIVDKLRMLLDITKEISRSLNLEELMKMVMDTLGSLIPNDAAAIYLLEKDQSGAFRFRTESLRGYEVEDLVDIKLQPGEGIV
ncbi:MAG TPA: hypothetical protein VF571_11770, partial [Pyrinomonadaceae bacterium]